MSTTRSCKRLRMTENMPQEQECSQGTLHHSKSLSRTIAQRKLRIERPDLPCTFFAYPDGVIYPIYTIQGGTTPPAFDQDAFRGRNDDGSKELATWIAPTNDDFIVEPDITFRVRFVIQETSGNKGKNSQFVLYFSHNGGAWTYLTTSNSNGIRTWLSTQIYDEETTTQQIGSGTYSGGWVNEDVMVGESDQIDVGANEEIEIECSLRVLGVNTSTGDTIKLRAYYGYTPTYNPLTSYTNEPTITIGSWRSSYHAYIAGGGFPDSSIPAYTFGVAKSDTEAMLWGGYDVGGNTRDAIHANMPDVIWPRLHAYCEGAADIRFDVVSFGAHGSAATQDITGDLNGYDGKVAFFMGHGAETNDTETPDQRVFFGFTNGTDQCWTGSEIEDEDTYSSYNTSGGVSTSRCAGMYYSSGGYAGFDSWIENGVRLDWSVGSLLIYDCAALLIGEPAGSDYIESHIGSWSNTDSETGDTVEVTGVGFKPDLVIMLNNLSVGNGGGAGFTVGAATRLENDGIEQGELSTAFGSGYFNWPGYFNNKSLIMAHGISDTIERWEITEWTDDGFNLECDRGNTLNDDAGTFIALKFGYPNTVKMNLTNTPQVTGDWTLTTNNKPEAVMTFYSDMGWNDYYPQNCSPHGMGFFDASTQVSGSARIGWGGTAWVGKSYTHDSRAMFLYGTTGTKDMEATVVSFHSGGYTLNYTLVNYNALISLAFGKSYDVKSSQSAYMFAHDYRQAAHIHGWDTTKSSQSVFFNVVDAYDSLPAYLDGDPDPTVRSDAGAYVKGTDTIVIAIANTTTATSTGTQDITTTELCGLTPKAVIITAFGVPKDEMTTSYWKTSVGITDGVYSSCVSAGSANDTSAPYRAICSKHRGPAATTNVVLITNPAGGTVIGKAEFDSFITNGIRLDWTLATSAHQISVTFFAGSDLDADVDVMALAGTSNTSTTAPGWRPDLVLFPGLINFDDETLLTITEGYGNETRLAWVIRDTDMHSAYIQYNSGAGMFGYEAWKYCFFASPMWAQWLTQAPSTPFPYPITGAAYTMFSFDTNGFTMKNNASAGNIVYLALRFGANARHRAAIGGQVVLRESDSGTVDYKIVPEEGGKDYDLEMVDYIWWSGAHNRTYEPWWPAEPDKGMRSYNHYGSYVGSQITAANTSSFSIANWGYFHDCYSQYFDQNSRMFYTTSFAIKYYYVLHDLWDSPPRQDLTLYLGWLLSKEKFIKNGIRLTWEHSDWPDGVLNTAHTMALAIGTPVYHDSTPAYMRGLIENWPGRTPRGCYLEGQTLGVDDAQDAFLKGQDVVTSDNNAYTFGQVLVESSQEAFMPTNAIDSSDQPVYIEGYQANVSSTPSHLHGHDHASAQQPVYLGGVDTADSSNEAYLFSASGADSNNEAFLSGQIAVDSSQSAYLTGPVNSETPAFTWGGWNPFTSTLALTWGSLDSDGSSNGYLHGGIFITDDTPAYTGGINTASGSTCAYLSAHVKDSVPGYLGGEIVIVDYAILTNSDKSLSKKFIVLYEGYSHGQLMKGSQVNRTVGGGTDLQPSAIYRVWEPTIKVMETENKTGYGDLADLETFYSYNDPDGTPSNVLTFRNHYQEEFQVIAMGELSKLVVTQKVEGTNAIYYVHLTLMEKK